VQALLALAGEACTPASHIAHDLPRSAGTRANMQTFQAFKTWKV